MVFYLKGILNYFDLNARIAKTHEVDNSDSIHNYTFFKVNKPIESNKNIHGYRAGEIDNIASQVAVDENILSENVGIYDIKDNVIVNHIPLWEQILMYVGTVIGVFFSSMVMQFNSSKIEILDYFNLTSLILSAIIALAIIPIVFEKLNVKANAPLLVRFGLFVQHGVFWQVTFNFIGGAYQTI